MDSAKNKLNLLAEANSLFDFTQAVRRDLHQHPELGFQEVRTAGIIVRELSQLGYEVSAGVAKTGVVAVMDGEGPGPVALLRFDMDALPIHEENECEYRSTQPGVMHACGHDGHVAVGLTVARLLEKHRKEWRGTVKLVFQPAEEGLGGAEAMLADGVLVNPAPQSALALHLWNERPVGWAAVHAGPLMAGGDIFTVTVQGRGGHGALPQNTIDPVLASAQIITALQSIVARNVSPLQSAIISVTQVHAGDAFNVIPQEAVLKGTIRTYEAEVRELTLHRFREVIEGVAAAMGCRVNIDLKRLTPAVISDERVTQAVAQAAASSLPDLRIDTDYRTTVSEDMAYLMEKVPGCYFLVGSANPERGLNYGHHHPRFDFDEQALPVGAALMTAAAMQLLNERSK